MDETDLTNRPAYEAALAIARKRHAGKTDDFGEPYYRHFVRVAIKLLTLFPNATEAQVQAALLHDAFEPPPHDEQELLRQGISPRAIEIIQRITLPRMPFDYLGYAEALAACGDNEALQVKYADNADALEYFPRLDSEEASRLLQQRYEPARQLMANALRDAAPS